MKRIVYTLLMAASATFAQAQVKIGANPGTIAPGAVLDVEGSTTTTRMVSLTNGNVGIGTTTPNAPLQFSNGLSARKIVLYEVANNDNQYFGLGVQPGMLRYQTATASNDDHVFMTGVSSTTSTELMRIRGTGNVGIGISAPNSKFQVEDNINSMLNVGFGNKNAGSGAFMAFRLYNDVANTYLFLNSSTRTADGGINAATLRNDAGILRLQSKAAAGINIDLDGNTVIDGSATIKNIALSGGTTMLTVDDNGLVHKQALPTASAPVIFGSRPSGAPDGFDITAKSPGPNLNDMKWTGLQIVIPAGSVYLVNAVQLLTTSTTPGTGTTWTYNQGSHFWLRTTLSTSSTVYTPIPGTVAGSNLISSALEGPLGILTGQIRVNNTSSTPLTLYYFGGYSIDSGSSFNTTSNGAAATPFNGTIFGFGSSKYQENQLYAIPTN